MQEGRGAEGLGLDPARLGVCRLHQEQGWKEPAGSPMLQARRPKVTAVAAQSDCRRSCAQPGPRKRTHLQQGDDLHAVAAAARGALGGRPPRPPVRHLGALQVGHRRLPLAARRQSVAERAAPAAKRPAERGGAHRRRARRGGRQRPEQGGAVHRRHRVARPGPAVPTRTRKPGVAPAPTPWPHLHEQLVDLLVVYDRDGGVKVGREQAPGGRARGGGRGGGVRAECVRLGGWAGVVCGDGV